MPHSLTQHGQTLLVFRFVNLAVRESDGQELLG
jgi:hypothetical protein